VYLSQSTIYAKAVMSEQPGSPDKALFWWEKKKGETDKDYEHRLKQHHLSKEKDEEKEVPKPADYDDSPAAEDWNDAT